VVARVLRDAQLSQQAICKLFAVEIFSSTMELHYGGIKGHLPRAQ
jgi:hypothetical protein